MTLQDTIIARLADLQTALTQLDSRYQTERTAIVTKIRLLTKATSLITPEIQGLIDQLGLDIPIV